MVEAILEGMEVDQDQMVETILDQMVMEVDLTIMEDLVALIRLQGALLKMVETILDQMAMEADLTTMEDLAPMIRM